MRKQKEQRKTKERIKLKKKWKIRKGKTKDEKMNM